MPEALVTCLAEARRPTPHEVEAVARWIWADLRGFGQWRGGAFGPQCPAYPRVIALARAALGLSPAVGATHRPAQRP